MTDRRRTLTYFGLVAPVLALSTMLLATLVDPKFAWQSRSLSSMGEATGRSLLAAGNADQAAFLLFNGGLVVGGLLGLPFGTLLWTESVNVVERAGVVAFALSLVSMSGIGVAYLDGPYDGLHFAFALVFYLLSTVTLLVYGSGFALGRDTRTGLAITWLGIGHLFVWVVWIVLEAFLWTGDGDTWTYFAVPEAVGAVLFGGWTLWTASTLYREGSLPS